jgi:CubicO group peptidase (beta-lactamase class C family)
LAYDPLEPEAYPLTWKAVREGFAQQVATAFGFGVLLPDGRAHVASFGLTALAPEGVPVQDRSVFDIASVSKGVATATLAALLVEQGKLDWEMPVADKLPGYLFPEIRLRHLLTHTAGFPAWEPLWQRMRDQFGGSSVAHRPIAERQKVMREWVLAIRPEVGVDVRVLYSDIGFLTLGFLLEEVTRLPLDQAVERLIWKKVGCVDSFYRRVDRLPPAARMPEVVATEICPWRGGTLQGQVHDDNTWVMGGYAGHAGVFSSVPDLLLYSRAFLQGLLSPSVAEMFWTRASVPVGCTRTYGWDTPSGEQSTVGPGFSSRTFGHLGFTGTSLWIDPEQRLAITLLTNRVHPTRENPKIQEFRKAFHRALAKDLGLN